MMFSANLRQLRKKYNYSQEYLADKLNVTRQTISKWENGTAMPDLRKLTEISEFFGVTMDYLLGTEGNMNVTDTADREFDNRYKEAYNKQLFAMIKENQEKQAKINHTLKVLIAVVAVALMVVSITFSFVYGNLSSQIISLQNSVNNVSAGSTIIEDKETIGDWADYEILSTDKENPNIATVKFSYAPDTYPKNAKVYLEVVDKNGKSKKTDAQLKSGSFITTIALDVTEVEHIYLFVDDGKNVSKEDMDINFIYEYFTIDVDNFSYSEHNYSEKKHEYSFDSVYWSKEDTFKPISKVYLIAKSDNKVIFENELKIKKISDQDMESGGYDYYADAQIVSMEQPADEFLLKFVDIDSNEYYVSAYDEDDLDDISEGNYKMIIFKNSKKLTYEN